MGCLAKCGTKSKQTGCQYLTLTVNVTVTLFWVQVTALILLQQCARSGAKTTVNATSPSSTIFVSPIISNATTIFWVYVAGSTLPTSAALTPSSFYSGLFQFVPLTSFSPCNTSVSPPACPITIYPSLATNGALDFSVTPSYTISVTTSDTLAASTGGTVSLVIIVQETEAPIWTSSNYSGSSVPDGPAGNSAGWSTSGLCTASTSGDTLEYSVSSCNNTIKVGFSTSTSTTLIFTQPYSITNGDPKSLVCVIICTDSTLTTSSSTTVTINVYAVNTLAPQFYTGIPTTATIYSQYNGQLVGTFPAFDPNQETITYNVLSVGLYYSYFGFAFNGSSPQLYVIKSMFSAYSATMTFLIAIQAVDSGSPQLSSNPANILITLVNTTYTSTSSSSTSSTSSTTTTSSCSGPSCGNTPSILGGVLGGVGGLLLIIGLAYLIYWCVTNSDSSVSNANNPFSTGNALKTPQKPVSSYPRTFDSPFVPSLNIDQLATKRFVVSTIAEQDGWYKL